MSVQAQRSILRRSVDSDLIAWKTSPVRRPMLVRGARQVGKTYTIEQFGGSHFKNFISVNAATDHQIEEIADA